MKDMKELFAEKLGVGFKYNLAMHEYICGEQEYEMCDECGEEECNCLGFPKFTRKQMN